ncbi:MAG: glycosyltransferase [Elusimicrobia bacterium]|nr:glycosyltransferase [Elusimicrobiota bacterium]
MIKVFEVVECGGPGGTGEQVAAICNGLDPARFEVSLVYAVRGGTPEAYRAKCAGAKAAYYVGEMTREISPALDAAALRRLRRLFAEHRPDVVHAHSSKAGILARAAAKAAGVPRVFYSPHGYGFLMRDRSRASRALYRLAEKAAARVGETIAISPSEAAFARGLSKKPVHVVCDAYLGDFPEPLPHDGLVVGSCGRMTYARDPDAWLLLAQRLTDSRNGVRCAWIGGGEDEARVRGHLGDMNLAGRVEVTGWLEAAAARERLRGLDVFVHYSRWDALPNAVLEAMAAGLPVVASDVPGNRDVVVDGETGFLARSEKELLELCQRLLDDPALRARLGAAGRERVRREFSRERMFAGLSRLYSGGAR